MLYRKVAAALIIIYHSAACIAQDSITSPELPQMRANARAYMTRGNYKDAVTTYKQLVAIAKNDYNVLAELSQAYAKNGEIEQATELFRMVSDMPGATDTTYCIISQVYFDAHQLRQANKFANWGLKKYPNSGILYEQHGLVYYNNGLIVNYAALPEWIMGMEKDPAYAGNYKQAALAAAGSATIWPMVWGETYLCMQHDTAGDAELKTVLFSSWKNYFDHLPETHSTGTAFEKYTANAFLQLTPVISDGVTVESLTMIKTRFMLQLPGLQSSDIPLWYYYNKLLREGWFDIYNESLYGQAESMIQYNAWTKFHAGDIEQLTQWLETHAIQPTATPGLYDPLDMAARSKPFKKKKR